MRAIRQGTACLPGIQLRPCSSQRPQQGVSRDTRGNPVAWVIGASDKVEQRALELDRAIGGDWLVAKGLAPGDRVIVEGLQKVRPGSAVRAVPFVAAAK